MSTAETPQPFPSLPTPTPSSDPRPEPTAAPVDVEVAGGGAAFPTQPQVRAALDRLEQLDLSDVTVAVFGGTAVLEGSVPRGADRDRITTALGRLSGVVEVDDRLRIRSE